MSLLSLLALPSFLASRHFYKEASKIKIPEKERDFKRVQVKTYLGLAKNEVKEQLNLKNDNTFKNVISKLINLLDYSIYIEEEVMKISDLDYKKKFNGIDFKNVIFKENIIPKLKTLDRMKAFNLLRELKGCTYYAIGKVFNEQEGTIKELLKEPLEMFNTKRPNMLIGIIINALGEKVEFDKQKEEINGIKGLFNSKVNVNNLIKEINNYPGSVYETKEV